MLDTYKQFMANGFYHLKSRNFTLESGGEQSRRQDLVSGGTTIEAPKARASRRQKRRVG